VLRSTGLETVETLFYHVTEPHVLPTSAPQNTLLRTIVEPHQQLRFLIMLYEEVPFPNLTVSVNPSFEHTNEEGFGKMQSIFTATHVIDTDDRSLPRTVNLERRRLISVVTQCSYLYQYRL